MNGIFGFTQLMNIPNLSEEKRKHYLSLINESTHQLLRIVSDIMDISKIETQQLRIHNKNININELLQNIFDFNKVQAESKGLSLELIKDLPNSIATFDADEDKIKTTFNNLISNSIKYTEEGFIQFGYNYTNNKLTFFVKDSGIGISPELHDYIFQRFSQAHPDDATKKYGGNGLGLAICKGITELLGGKIWVESQKGNGATFFFHLPLKQVSLTKKHIGHNIHNVNILIVEDEDNNFLYLQEILDKEPYNLSRALNGKEAVEMALKTDFQIILMDLAMPIMDGYTAIKAIKKERPAIYIIAQTAYAMKDDKEKAFSAGCDDYITKPVNGVILKRLLRNSISSKTSKQ
jgi:CheY-like chemotaxis protein